MSEEQDCITVLLVDDEENILSTLKRLLMDEDFAIVTALSGEDGLEKLQNLDQVGLIISDQRMPGMNGAEFLRRSREIVPHALRILLTGYSDINATIDAINKGGASRYISKPWNDDELVRVIRESVAQYFREREVRRLNVIIDRQKQELADWNDGLKKRLFQSTATIRAQSEAISNLSAKSSLTVLSHTFDNLFEIMGDQGAVHARTVSTLVTDVAGKMGLDGETVELFRLAALLHDIGKFGSHFSVQSKYLDDMSESESNEYFQHSAKGERMVAKVKELAGILPLIRGHHEAFDGSGFPDGLKGEAIPLGARLITIADQIDKAARAVKHHRADYAMMKIGYYRGTLLDPQLIARFKSIAEVVYFEGKNMLCPEEIEIEPKDLVPGMTLIHDVKTAADVLLMQHGTVLDAVRIALIRNHYGKNPPQTGIFVRLRDDTDSESHL